MGKVLSAAPTISVLDSFDNKLCKDKECWKTRLFRPVFLTDSAAPHDSLFAMTS